MLKEGNMAKRKIKEVPIMEWSEYIDYEPKI
jgi:hypothetical protein